MANHCRACIDFQKEIDECLCLQKPACGYCVDLKKDIRECDCTAADAPLATPEPFVIEKGIPIPPLRSENPNGDLLWSMEIGDSVFLPGENENIFRHYMRKFSKLDRKYTQRIVPGGFRVWRTK